MRGSLYAAYAVGQCGFVLSTLLFVAASLQDVANVKAQAPDATSPIQLVPRTKAEREQKYQDEHRISFIVQVADSSGSPVTGLKAEDFSVLDNQKSQHIEKFREVNGKTFTADVQVVIVLDGINDGGSAVGHVEKELGEILSHGTGRCHFRYR